MLGDELAEGRFLAGLRCRTSWRRLSCMPSGAAPRSLAALARGLTVCVRVMRWLSSIGLTMRTAAPHVGPGERRKCGEQTGTGQCVQGERTHIVHTEWSRTLS